jgi:hypothetical protein
MLPEHLYDGAMELYPGHIHQAENVAGIVATIWPTPWPDLWHVSTSRKQATEEPVPTDQVEALLAAWNFYHDRPWTHWKGPLHERNPQPEIWAMYDAIS